MTAISIIDEAHSLAVLRNMGTAAQHAFVLHASDHLGYWAQSLTEDNNSVMLCDCLYGK